jgi:hypothetical protein
MRNDSADDLERFDAANLHCEIHYLLLQFLIPTWLTPDLKKKKNILIIFVKILPDGEFICLPLAT